MVANLSKPRPKQILKTNGTTQASMRCRTKARKERKANSSSIRRRERAPVEQETKDSSSITTKVHLIKTTCNSSSSRKMSNIRIPIQEGQVLKTDPS